MRVVLSMGNAQPYWPASSNPSSNGRYPNHRLAKDALSNLIFVLLRRQTFASLRRKRVCLQPHSTSTCQRTKQQQKPLTVVSQSRSLDSGLRANSLKNAHPKRLSWGSVFSYNPRSIRSVFASAGLIALAFVKVWANNLPGALRPTSTKPQWTRKCMAKICANKGGIAFPICLIRSEAFPLNLNQSGNVCMRAHSRKVNGRLSFGCINSLIATPVMVKLGSSKISRLMPEGAPPLFSVGVPSITRRFALRLKDS